VRGNVLNPLDTIEKYGTDALRFALSTGTTPGSDIKLTPSRLEAGRNFANKLWNATRFIIASTSPDKASPKTKQVPPLEDRWVLSRLNGTIASVISLLENYQFGEAERQIHDFLWGEFCDWYIEIAKIRLRSAPDSQSPLPVLVQVLETSLRLLHPFMPFLTEELWQNLRKYLPQDEPAGESIAIAAYPQPNKAALDRESEQVVETLIEIIRSIRNVRAEHKVASSRWITAQIYVDQRALPLDSYTPVIETLARAKPLTFYDSRQEPPPGENNLVLVLKEAVVAIPMESMVSLAAERKRLKAEIAQSEAGIAQLETRLKSESFLQKAPLAVVDKERSRLAISQARLSRLRDQLEKLGED
jgi:valyl-tRNA synthetase